MIATAVELTESRGHAGEPARGRLPRRDPAQRLRHSRLRLRSADQGQCHRGHRGAVHVGVPGVRDQARERPVRVLQRLQVGDGRGGRLAGPDLGDHPERLREHRRGERVVARRHAGRVGRCAGRGAHRGVQRGDLVMAGERPRVAADHLGEERDLADRPAAGEGRADARVVVDRAGVRVLAALVDEVGDPPQRRVVVTGRRQGEGAVHGQPEVGEARGTARSSGRRRAGSGAVRYADRAAPGPEQMPGPRHAVPSRSGSDSPWLSWRTTTR